MIRFQDFVEDLKAKLIHPLPGEKAQLLMAPASRAEMIKNTDILKKARKAAVLMLLFPVAEEPNLIFIQRQQYDGVHSGQISFPGGKIEKGDKNLIETAKRETSEEIGIPSEEIEILGQTSSLYIPPSRFIVQPVIGITGEIKNFQLQKKEVDSVITIKLKDLIGRECRAIRTVKASYLQEIEVPCFSINGNIIWGATAMILSELIEIIGSEILQQ